MLFTVVVAYIPLSLVKLTDRTNTHAHTVRTDAGKIRTHTSITILFLFYTRANNVDARACVSVVLFLYGLAFLFCFC